MFFMGTRELLDVKVRALKCFGSQQQLDMNVFRQLAEVAHRQYVHHRVVQGLDRSRSCRHPLWLPLTVSGGKFRGDTPTLYPGIQGSSR